MGTMHDRLEHVGHLLNESLGVRTNDVQPKLSPVPAAKDLGRRPLRGYGRVDIEHVIADPTQPRAEFDQGSLASLAANIQAKGQLHPIHVRWSDEAERWVIVSGERRWRASRAAGLASVDCFFHEQPLTKAQVLELQLVENLLREDLRPIEEARAFQSLMELNGWNGKQVAEALRIPASKVSRALAMLDLPSDIQQQVEAGTVAARTAYHLSRVTNGDAQRQLASLSASGALTNTSAAHAVSQLQTRRPSKARQIRKTFYADNECKVFISAPPVASYQDLETALTQALEEVRLRIENNVRL